MVVPDTIVYQQKVSFSGIGISWFLIVIGILLLLFAIILFFAKRKK